MITTRAWKAPESSGAESVHSDTRATRAWGTLSFHFHFIGWVPSRVPSGEGEEEPP